MNNKLNLDVNQNNIFHRHFFHFGIAGLCGILGFCALCYIGWYELALTCVLATPCNIPGYLLLIRKRKTNRKENTAMAFIFILAIVLLAAAVILVIQFRIDELLDKGGALTWLWRFCELFIFQLLCISCGVFPKSPRE